jgi:surfactin synthase thioesterase subunit
MLESELTALWQQLLGGRPVAVTDDFFELGGHSLVAARMIQQVGALTGRPVSFATLYENPTIAGLVRALAGQTPPAAEASAPAMTLNPGGHRPPLLLFHGILNGGALYALRLARLLGADQPIHVVHPHLGTDRPLPPTIEAMADDLLTVVRSLQPRGPYRMLGYCNGGLVAYEVARRLQREGESVELVGLLAAAPTPLLNVSGRVLRDLGRRLGLPAAAVVEPIARLRTLVEVTSAQPVARRLGFALRLLARKMLPRAQGAAGPPPAPPGDDADAIGNAIMDAYYRIMMRYFPGRYHGPVVLLWPEREPWASPARALRTWRRLTGSTALHVVPGDHDGAVRDHLDVIARHLDGYLAAPPGATR